MKEKLHYYAYTLFLTLLMVGCHLNNDGKSGNDVIALACIILGIWAFFGGDKSAFRIFGAILFLIG